MSNSTKVTWRRYVRLAVVVLLLVWFFIVLSQTVFGRKPFDGNHFQPELFWSYRSVQMKEAWFVRQIIGNVIMYMPFGFLFPLLLNRKLSGWKVFAITLIAGLAISFSTEFMQYIFRIGLFEFDDMFHNGLGIVIGFLIHLVFVRAFDFLSDIGGLHAQEDS